MSYLVLARKYRPQTFDEIVGQDAITRTLRNALAQGRTHHAYLFCGSRGIGKTTTARILAKALNCEKGPTPDPCGVCVSCEEIRAGAAVDVIEIDGASHTSVDDIRDLRENVRYLPARGRRKIYIIDEVHQLSQAAFNALLKTLEEPPEHVSFIFATTEPHKIPATILSRCQRFDFRRLSDSALRKHMRSIVDREQIEITEEALGLIARVAEGGVRDALSLLDQVIAYAGGKALDEKLVAEVLGVADRRSLTALTDAVLRRDATSALAIVDEVFRAGHDLGRFAQAFLGHLRDVVVAAAVADPGALLDVTESERREIERQAKSAERTRWTALFDRFAAALDQITKAQSSKVVLEVAILDLLDAEVLLPMGDLIERLESLETKLTTATASHSSSTSSMGGGLSGSGGAGGSGGKAPNPSPSPSPSPNPSASPSPSPPRASASTAPTTETPPVADAGATPASGPRSWTAFVAELDKMNPRLASIFAEAKPLRVDADEVVLGFVADSFSLEQATERAQDLAQAVSARWGQAVRVKIQPVAAQVATPPSVTDMEEAHRAADRDVRKREAMDHPTVKAAIEVLGGDVREIKAP